MPAATRVVSAVQAAWSATTKLLGGRHAVSSSYRRVLASSGFFKSDVWTR